MFVRLNHRRGQAASLNNLAFNRAQLGDHDGALAACEEALAIARELGDAKGEGHCRDSLAYIHHAMGEHERAVENYLRAVALFDESGARHAEAVSWTRLGDTYAEIDDRDAARGAWRSALKNFEDLDHPGADAVRTRIATGGVPSAAEA
jgi:tetratricopeptide (TPR) repeat protein